MSNSESMPNLNNSEINPVEAQEDVNVDEKFEGELIFEEQEEPELTPEEQLENLEAEIEAKREEVNRLLESIEGLKSDINVTREKLGLPPTEEEPPSTFSEKDKLKQLKVEQEALEKQKKELISQQEKEQLIRKEKEKIQQEKLDEVFKEFEEFSLRDFESITKSGKTREGHNVESKTMGSLDPEVAQTLAKAFKEGIKLLSKILEVSPNLLKKFDEELIRKATERVDKKLEEEQKKEDKSEELKPEEESEILKDEIPQDETKTEANSIEDGNIETPKT